MDDGGIKDRLEMESVDVRLYWHPLLAHHAQEFFLSVVWKLGGWDKDGRSKRCVKIALGDDRDNDDGVNEIIVYGQSACVPVPDPSEAHSPTTIHFIATRLLPPKPSHLHPHHKLRRLPRPDDPLPRKPLLASSSAHGSPGRKGLKRLASASQVNQDRLRKKGKIVLADGDLLSKQVFNRAKSASALLFNDMNTRPTTTKPLVPIPGPPLRRTKSRTCSISSIGGVSDVDDGVFKVPSVTAKRKADPVVVVPDEGFESQKNNEPELSELEKSNKNTIKKLAVSCLAARGISKDHPEFKELYNWSNRGVQFALRKSMNVRKLERECVKTLLLKHIDMYMDEPPFTPPTTIGL
ncbi:hypothetical protein FRC03_011516 [Tulasnella sp. 419]|nr:hypothetical protein FRC03_011516 [Tulasnella sp. 419]